VEQLLLPLLVALTSFGAYAVGTRVFGLPRHGLALAVRYTLDVAGLTVVFLAVNLGLGLAVVLGSRALSMRFVSVYILNDTSLIALSALQAVVVGSWWRLSPGARGEDVKRATRAQL